MNEAAARWVRGLPMRWTVGGLVLGLAWALASGAGWGGSNPVGGYIAGVVRVLWMMVLPLGVLGFFLGMERKTRS
jgi:hypothetical protein